MNYIIILIHTFFVALVGPMSCDLPLRLQLSGELLDTDKIST